MIKYNYILIFICFLLTPVSPVMGKPAPNLLSPDGNMHFILQTENKQLFFSVTLNGKTVIEKSPLRMMIDSVEITNGIKTGAISNYNIDETYPWYGIHSVAINRCNGFIIDVKHIKSAIAYKIDIRLFNDAAAFRLIVPGTDNVQRKPDETTVFTFPLGCTSWYHDINGHYEGVHKKRALDTVPAGQWVAPPLTVKLPGDNGYAAITEGDLKNYAGMALQTDGKCGFVTRLAHAQPVSYPYELRYSKEDVERLSKIAAVKGTISTPWRIIMAAKDLNTLVNCDAVHNLCPAPDKKLFPEGMNTTWIRPGRAVWKYLDGGGDGTLQTMKEFSRMASDLGFEHNILEGFWRNWTDEEIKELVNYSNKLCVGIWIWKHSKELRDSSERLRFFKTCHDLGITGLKIDFFDHEAKEVIDLYQSILRETAQLKLLVNFHGANKPTGESRTWPNELTREGIRGMEASRLADRATHNTTVPFTRFLAGHAEYTPVHFGDRRKNTTWTHQIASAAIFWTPMLTYAASPANLLSNPAVEMIKSIPSTWDETLALPSSEIGELVAYAQRKGNTWFLSVINGQNPKIVRIPLSFLSDKEYNTLIVRDNKDNSASVKLENKMSKKTDIIEIELGEGGGFIARFGTGTAPASKPKRGTSPGVPGAHLNYTPGSVPDSWAKATAETVMARYPDYRTAYWKDWSYVQGYMFCGFEMLYRSTGDKKYMEYIKQYIDHFVDKDGNYTGDKLTNLDNLMTATSIVAMYQYTGDERYKKAAMQFRKVFDTYPRTDGQFWHGNGKPNMWIDGIFMGQMFLIRYGQVIGDASYSYEEAARQITVFSKHCAKGNSGLYLHAWSEKPKETAWADTITGLSPEVWSEGLGWYALVIPELLAVIPKDHPKYSEVLSIYTRLAEGLKNTQDTQTGGWYMIVDKGTLPGNWIDPSGTAMFVYSIQRGIDLGLLDKKTYGPVAKRGFESLAAFVKINDNGLVDVLGAGDGISVKKDFATYVNVPRITNAKEAVAGFLWASAIMEKTKQ